ncbi:MAG: NAD(+) synthase, partial [Akkermansia sp.]|nr:NAD(+) synthase [Akkermansia sp.]
GGLDSTLALLVAVEAMERLGRPSEDVIAITMPGFGTTDRTYDNAMKLMRLLGVTIREIPIREAVRQHFADIGHDEKIHDLTYENAQARERTQILMDYAGKVGGIVVGTGDLSELALGWCTYNGDHMSMYSVNCSVPKTLIRCLISHVVAQSPAELAAVLQDVVDTPVSPELLPPADDGSIEQKTEDVLGPYDLHDFFLYHFIKYGAEGDKLLALAKHAFAGQFEEALIEKTLTTFMRRFFTQQFKRSCVPDGPKVGTIALSPRGDWRMPTDVCGLLWQM